MQLQKAKSSNLAGNNFSVRLRCDVLAHRSTNSRVPSQSAGRSADAAISAAGARSRSTQPHRLTNSRAHRHTDTGNLEKMPRLARRAPQPWGVGRQFATLQHGDCTVCFVCLLPSYFQQRNCMKVQLTSNCYSVTSQIFSRETKFVPRELRLQAK